ncbi:MAG: flavodoxin family protein [Candidatus Puniceispirillales bacterium]
MDTKTLLFIAHAPSPNTVSLRDAVRHAVETETGLRLIIRSPFEADAEDALAADAVLIGTTENIGYMAGATKDFFDRSYNTLLEVSAGKPAAIYIRAGLDGTGSRRALEGIMTGLRWRLVAPILILHGNWQNQYPDEAAALGLGLAAGLEIGAF